MFSYIVFMIIFVASRRLFILYHHVSPPSTILVFIKDTGKPVIVTCSCVPASYGRRYLLLSIHSSLPALVDDIHYIRQPRMFNKHEYSFDYYITSRSWITLYQFTIILHSVWTSSIDSTPTSCIHWELGETDGKGTISVFWAILSSRVI